MSERKELFIALSLITRNNLGLDNYIVRENYKKFDRANILFQLG